MRSRLVALLTLVIVLAGLPVVVAAQEASPTPPAAAGRTDIRFFVPFGPDGLNPTLTVTEEVTGSCNELSLANFGRADAWFCNEAETGAIHDPCFENQFGAFDEPATLACVVSPFSTETILLTTTEPLVREKDLQPPAGAVPPPAGAPGAPGAPGPAGPAPSGDPPSPDIVPGQAPGPGPVPVPMPPSDPSLGGTSGAMSAEVGVDPLSIPWAVELVNGDRCGLLTGATSVVAGMRLNYGCEGGGYIVGDLDRFQPTWTANYYDEQALGTELVDVAVVWT